jgi:hypothetical protein
MDKINTVIICLGLALALIVILYEIIRLSVDAAGTLAQAAYNKRWCKKDHTLCLPRVDLSILPPKFPKSFTSVTGPIRVGANVIAALSIQVGSKFCLPDGSGRKAFPEGSTDGKTIATAKYPHLVAIFNAGDTTYVCIRGTHTFTDALTDTDLSQQPISEEERNVLVHLGFFKVWKEIEYEVLSFPLKENVLVIGHSMGAGIAQIGAYRLQRSYPKKRIGCIAIAPPRTGNPRFAEAIWDTLDTRLAIYINTADVVPATPLSVMPATSGPEDNVTIWEHSQPAIKSYFWNFESLGLCHSVLVYAHFANKFT